MHVLIIPPEHFVTPHYPTGGIFQLDQARALQRAGHTVGVINPGVISPRFLFQSYKYRDHEVIDGIPVLRRYVRKLRLQRYTAARPLIQVREQIGQLLFRDYVRAYGRPDVIHAHDVLFSAGVARALHFEHRIPYIITEHSNSFAVDAISEAAVQAARVNAVTAGAVTAVSPFLTRLIANHLSIDEQTIQILPNVLGLEFVTDAPPPDRNGRVMFLSVASLDANKDQLTLLKAFAACFKDTAATLRIAGSGPHRRQLEAAAERFGIRGQVTFLGMLDRLAVRAEMQRAHCFVLSSRVETFGVVLIEALSCGVPVVATRSGGPDHIVGESDGFLVPVADHDQLGVAMAEIAHDAGRFRPAQLRANCLTRFGPDAFVANAERYYRQALEN